MEAPRRTTRRYKGKTSIATPETWDKVAPFFKPNSLVDKWGEPYELQDEHLLRLYYFRLWLGIPVYVTNAVKTSGHSENSYHYSRIVRGVETGKCATDIVIPDYGLSPFDLVLEATRFGFTGIGYYSHWKFNGETVGGLHVDSRPLVDGAGARWMGVSTKGKDGKKATVRYMDLTFQNMLKYSSYGAEILGSHFH